MTVVSFSTKSAPITRQCVSCPRYGLASIDISLKHTKTSHIVFSQVILYRRCDAGMKTVAPYVKKFKQKKLYIPLQLGERTGLVVRASDSGSGDPGSIFGRVGVLFP